MSIAFPTSMRGKLPSMRRAVMGAGAALCATLFLGARPTAMRPSMRSAPCTTSEASVTPCGTNVTKTANTSGYTQVFTVQNRKTRSQIFDVSCAVSGAVTSCSRSPTFVSISASSSKTVTVTYATGSGISGTVSLQAFGDALETEGFVNVSVSTPMSVSVTPDGAAATLSPFASSTYDFTVRNTGSGSATFNLTGICGGTASGCVASPSSVTLGVSGTATGSVSYSVGNYGTSGTVQLKAEYASNTTINDLGTLNVSVPHVYAVATIPDNEAAVVNPNRSYTKTFTVRNDGSTTESFTMSIGCSPAASPGINCDAPSPGTTPALAPNASTNVSVNYTIGAMTPGATGQVVLTAAEVGRSSVIDAGSLAITVEAPMGNPIASLAGASSTPTIERDLCLTASAGAEAAYECGDLRLAHPLPLLVTMAKARAPTLLYNSQHARPYPLIPLNVTIPSGIKVPDQIAVTMTVPGHAPVSVNFSGGDWVSGATRRVAIGYDASADSTDFYGYSVLVENVYGATRFAAATLNGELAVVNRAGSYFGAGWWLGGFERLVHPGADAMLWVGGDGSTRKYTRVAPGNSAWVTPSVDRPDTIKQVGAEFIRYASHGVTVTFDGSGRHIRTANRLSQVTSFWQGSGRLDSIGPPTVSSSARRRFVLSYVNGQLDTFTAWADDSSRSVRLFHPSGARVESIQDPDLLSVSFGYAGSNRVASRTDRRGVATFYEYDAAGKLSRDSLDLQTTPASWISTHFWPAESRGYANGNAPAGTARDTVAVYTKIDGPRTDVTDTMLFWVDRFGAPRRIVDALAKVTTLSRGDTRFPGLVTRVVHPLGLVDSATFDARGNVATHTAENPYGDGRNAVTSYEWNQVFDVVSKVVPPERDSTAFGYDGLGNRIWQQDARGLAAQVQFNYNARGQLTSTSTPVQRARGFPRDSVEYDALLGNVTGTRTPNGYWARSYADAFGRDTLTTTPISTDTSVKQRVRTTYDAIGRVLTTTTVGPPLDGAPAETVFVRNYYTTGMLDSVVRWARPDTNNISTISTGWRYDRAGRKLREIASDGLPDIYEYDGAGNIIKWTTRRNHVIQMQYDAMNRLIQRDVPQVYYAHSGSFPRYDGGAGLTLPADVQTFGYDDEGHILFARNGDAWVGRTYYRNGALATDTLHIRMWATADFSAHVYPLAYRYDLNGRRTQLILPPNLAMRDGNGFSYIDSLATTYTSWGQVQLMGGAQFTYDLDSRVDSVYRTGWVYEKRLYDDPDGMLTRRILRQRVASRWNGANTAQIDTIFDDRLNYDPRDKILTATQIKRCSTTQYDGLGAVARMTTEHPCTIGAIDDEYDTTDALGNVKANRIAPDGGSGTVTNFGYEAHTGREISSVSSSSSGVLYYDGAGNRYWSDRKELMTGPDGPVSFQVATASYYDGLQQLRVVDRRTAADLTSSTLIPFNDRGTFDTYRYDALGRRVLVRAQRDSACASACQSYVQRTVWDGDQILYEIRYGEPNIEQDTGFVGQEEYHLEDDLPRDTTYSPFVGRVLYLHGPGIDAPMGLIRADYGRSTAKFNPFGIHLVANWRGAIAAGVYNGNLETTNCVTASHYAAQHGTERVTESVCLQMDWSEPNTAYRKAPMFEPRSWFGSLVTEKKDASGMLYSRNRYYDPQSGKFTQEDPIGLAGGLNLYGFASGDPVNRSDPFGLRDTVIVDDEARKVVEDCVRASEQCARSVNDLANDKTTWYIRTGNMPSFMKPSPGATSLDWFGEELLGGTITIDPSQYAPASTALNGLPVNSRTVLGHELGHAVGALALWRHYGQIRGCGDDRYSPCATVFENIVRGQINLPKRSWP